MQLYKSFSTSLLHKKEHQTTTVECLGACTVDCSNDGTYPALSQRKPMTMKVS